MTPVTKSIAQTWRTNFERSVARAARYAYNTQVRPYVEHPVKTGLQSTANTGFRNAVEQVALGDTEVETAGAMLTRGLAGRAVAGTLGAAPLVIAGSIYAYTHGYGPKAATIKKYGTPYKSKMQFTSRWADVNARMARRR